MTQLFTRTIIRSLTQQFNGIFQHGLKSPGQFFFLALDVVVPFSDNSLILEKNAR